MQIHDLKPKNKLQRKRRIGRGGKRGTYSGKGVKGQKCRAGAKMPPIARELIKRYPKLRGYRFSPLKKCFVVNIAVLDNFFNNNDVISPKSLIKKGVAKRSKRYPVKILGIGETKKKFTVVGCHVSQKAKDKIEKAGGVVK